MLASGLCAPEPLTARARSVDTLSDDQRVVFETLKSWTDSPSGTHSLGGLAGTGKTFIVGRLARALEGRRRVAYVAFTARAASVLRSNLPASVDLKPKAPAHLRETPRTERLFSFRRDASSFCGTIHALIYRPRLNAREEVVGWERRDTLDQSYDLIVVDEASMVDDAMLGDLRRHGVPILAVGDHGQLPPVGGKSTTMAEPSLRLERIHRQAEGSHIIQLAHAVRSRGVIDTTLADGRTVLIKHSDYLDAVLKDAFGQHRSVSEVFDTALISWRNKRRVALNQRVREIRFGSAPPLPRAGELVLNLRNFRMADALIANGVRGVLATEPVEGPPNTPWQVDLDVIFEGDRERRSLVAFGPQFGRAHTFERVHELHEEGVDVDRMGEAGALLDFGYALTCHKAQGSGFKNVIVVTDMPPTHQDWRRWMYTACTRARERLTIVAGVA